MHSFYLLQNNKKLRQIDDLKTKQKEGKELEKNQV